MKLLAAAFLFLISTSSFSSLDGVWRVDSFECSNKHKMSSKKRQHLKSFLKKIKYEFKIDNQEITRTLGDECRSYSDEFIITDEAVEFRAYGVRGVNLKRIGNLKERVTRDCYSRMRVSNKDILLINNNSSDSLEVMDLGVDKLRHFCSGNSEVRIIMKKKIDITKREFSLLAL